MQSQRVGNTSEQRLPGETITLESGTSIALKQGRSQCMVLRRRSRRHPLGAMLKATRFLFSVAAGSLDPYKTNKLVSFLQQIVAFK